jgi:hypothetical protein
MPFTILVGEGVGSDQGDARKQLRSVKIRGLQLSARLLDDMLWTP